MPPEDDPADENRDLCGLRGLPGADKMATWTGAGVYWPGERRSETELVHQECEQEETRRAHSELSQAERDRFLDDVIRGA